jgi:hypothetical protein
MLLHADSRSVSGASMVASMVHTCMHVQHLTVGGGGWARSGHGFECDRLCVQPLMLVIA